MVTTPLLELPDEIASLRSIALDLRWTWSHEGDALWGYIDEKLWDRTLNPWTVLQGASRERLKQLAADKAFLAKLKAFEDARTEYLTTPGWFRDAGGHAKVGGIAYFSMEFGLGSSLPIYAGGLGILAGDVLKSASDLDIPVVGIGLLYQEGYFRQLIDSAGMQLETYPYNEPAAMPVEPVILPEDGWLRIGLELPGRIVYLRVWKATVGRVTLYLLDSNDPVNSPLDRGITAKLYGGGPELRLMQEIVLGVGGWRVIEALHPEVEICHVNEGHAAFAIIERARQLALKSNLDFWEALWATRAGNLFTTHTPVAAGFDRFPADLLRKYLPYVEGALHGRGVKIDDVIALGRADPSNHDEAFNMAFLAARGSGITIGVSRLHGEVSRRIFQPLFPRWPSCEVPVGYVTNGVHIPTWDSTGSDRIWNKVYGKGRWRTPTGKTREPVSPDVISDEELWSMRGEGRQRLVRYARQHLSRQLREGGFSLDEIRRADTVLDPNVLTLGFARRFTEYKRPNLLLRDLERFDKLLHNAAFPVQIVVAGKAHPADGVGKEMIQSWINLARNPRYRHHVLFLEDYDISLAQELTQGVDVWINTPRRPWEACGTSGMKVLVNGGINCSTLDGWWDEAYTDEVGWSIGDGSGGAAEDVDARDIQSLYEVLEKKVIPEFYDRDSTGLPRAWLNRIRESMGRLTPQFSGARMMTDYVEQAYYPLAKTVRERLKDRCAEAKAMNQWARLLHSRWNSLHIGQPVINQNDGAPHVVVPVYLGEVEPGSVRVEMFADQTAEHAPEVIMLHQEHPIVGSTNGYIFAGAISSPRPLEDFTVRVVPYHPGAHLPAELPLISWQK
ncbi:starch phosphorylase [Rhizomicrobium palustre]|uniref:Starch phosphorylase n=1 Tax=Rhizomicrobium palustre TaxID=189966 RepID=A0A846MZR7_9PROT|nr:alpha-glucan family phosphorylase [Rhizomicrobium palustre]NIK88450.1 starch phosphorylase [Rhizomicrobium palustre]